jgi:Mn-dependent DtxR family transcriptional regulator
MRKSAKGMSLWDDRILEVIHEEGSGSPTELSESDYIRVSQQHVSRRLKKLEEYGLVKRLGNAVYILTDEGEAYLHEEYDVEAGTYVGRDVANGGNGPSESAGETENGV